MCYFRGLSEFHLVSTFLTKFKLEENSRKIMRAFWEIDHGNCEVRNFTHKLFFVVEILQTFAKATKRSPI